MCVFRCGQYYILHFASSSAMHERSDRYSNRTVVIGSVVFWSMVIVVVVITVSVLVTRMDTNDSPSSSTGPQIDDLIPQSNNSPVDLSPRNSSDEQPQL